MLLAQPSTTFPQGINLAALGNGVLKSTVTGGVAQFTSLPAPTSALVGVDDAQIVQNKTVVPRFLPVSDPLGTPLTLNVEAII